jgi:O-antigen polymerase
MEKMGEMLTKLKNSLFLWIVFFLFAPFYYQLNTGGSGFELTFNIAVWAVACWLMAFGIWLICYQNRFIYPKNWFYFVLFPIVIVLVSLFSQIEHPITWLFRLLYLLGGMIFLFSLFQLTLKQSVIDKILCIIVLSSGLHALIGISQTFWPTLIVGYFPIAGDAVPRGMFQQINVQVSFMATSAIIFLYILSRPIYKNSATIVQFFLLLSFALSLYIIIASGSRTGLLSIILGFPLVLISRRKWIFSQKKLVVTLLLISLVSIYCGRSGLEFTLDKAARATAIDFSQARISMYKIGVDLIKDSPLLGHGIGDFLSVWNLKSADFMLQNPGAFLPEQITHPHNEILFWVIEAGLPALLGILVLVIGIILGLYNCGFQRGSAYAAMLIPISLHTQVELPFYISSLHWFIWLFLIFIILKHQSRKTQLGLSKAANSSLKILAILFSIGSTLFFINTARAQADLFAFKHDVELPPPYLMIAMNNIYYRPLAEEVVMRTLLRQSIINNDPQKVREFEVWAKEYTSASPRLEIYMDLLKASIYLRPEEKGCDVVVEGLKMYSRNEKLLAAKSECKRIGD